jgi:hypothetical protein
VEAPLAAQPKPAAAAAATAAPVVGERTATVFAIQTSLVGVAATATPVPPAATSTPRVPTGRRNRTYGLQLNPPPTTTRDRCSTRVRVVFNLPHRAGCWRGGVLAACYPRTRPLFSSAAMAVQAASMARSP